MFSPNGFVLDEVRVSKMVFLGAFFFFFFFFFLVLTTSFYVLADTRLGDRLHALALGLS